MGRLMGSLFETPPKLQRRHIKDLSAARCIDGDTAMKLSYLLQSVQRQKDLSLIQTAMINRYAQVVKEVSLASGATEKRIDTPDSVTDIALQKAILAGQYETIRLDLLNSIVSQSATLFTEPTQTFTYTPSNKKVQKLIEGVRAESGSEVSTVLWDAYACACKSSLLYLSVAGAKLKETPVPVTAFRWAFAPTIREDIGGMVTERATMTDELDEATAIGMQIESVGSTKRWAVWYGPSDMYPLGRYCIFEAREWHDVPDPTNPAAMKDCLDYTISGQMRTGAPVSQMANPLSLWADRSKDWSIPTYPFAICYHDLLNPGLLPVSTSLYEICRELDLAASVVLMGAVKGSKPTRALKRGEMSEDIPDADEGLILLGRGDELLNVGWPPDHARKAQEVIEQMARHVAEANHVAGWMVVADQTGEPPTGIALETMADDMGRFREQRIALNRAPAQGRRFQIEKALINATRGRASKAGNGSEAIPPDTVEHWDPGKRIFPRDKATVVKTWVERIAAGEADLADMVQDLRRLKTREQALNFLDERAKEKAKAAEAEGGDVQGLQLSVTDAPKYVTVNEARKSQGLGPLMLDDGTENPDGNLTISQYEQKQLAAQQKPGGTLAAKTKAGAFAKRKVNDGQDIQDDSQTPG